MMNNVEQIKSIQVILKLKTVLLVPMVNFHIRTSDKNHGSPEFFFQN